LHTPHGTCQHLTCGMPTHASLDHQRPRVPACQLKLHTLVGTRRQTAGRGAPCSANCSKRKSSAARGLQCHLREFGRDAMSCTSEGSSRRVRASRLKPSGIALLARATSHTNQLVKCTRTPLSRSSTGGAAAPSATGAAMPFTGLMGLGLDLRRCGLRFMGDAR
jgi:hypothetical protein